MIIIPHRISRSFIQEHREWNFVYSADYRMKSFFGQACDAHGESNSFPVPTLFKFCANPVYFRDNEMTKEMIDEFLKRIPQDKPIIPFPHIGEGRSRMKEFSPRMWEYLKLKLMAIRAEHEIDYLNGLQKTYVSGKKFETIS